MPTDAEWQTLIDYLGGEDVAGGKLKETGTVHWTSPNTGATNESCFSALPGGCRRYEGNYNNMGISAKFWASTEYDGGSSWRLHIGYYESQVGFGPNIKGDGYSVRCVKD